MTICLLISEMRMVGYLTLHKSERKFTGQRKHPEVISFVNSNTGMNALHRQKNTL